MQVQWRVKVHDHGVTLGVVPDRMFALEYADQGGQLQRVYFFLEADRGTMPGVRNGLTQTSFYRKLLAYEATWAQKVRQRKLGIHRFRVLTVTTNVMRVASLLEACSRLKRGHGLFLFADRTVLEKRPVLLPSGSAANPPRFRYFWTSQNSGFACVKNRLFSIGLKKFVNSINNAFKIQKPAVKFCQDFPVVILISR